MSYKYNPAAAGAVPTVANTLILLLLLIIFLMIVFFVLEAFVLFQLPLVMMNTHDMSAYGTSGIDSSI